MTRALSVLLVLAGGCAANASLIEVGGRAAPADTLTCSFEPGGRNILGPGTLDFTAAGTALPNYQMVVYVTNNLQDPGTVTAGSPATSTVQQVNPTPLAGQPLQPAGGTATQLVEALSGPLGMQLAQFVADGETRRVVLGITLLGTPADGASLDTAEWVFPLDLCKGCLPTPSCPAGQVLSRTNCFSFFQDSAPACVAAL
jgi:hypothetical protein